MDISSLFPLFNYTLLKYYLIPLYFRMPFHSRRFENFIENRFKTGPIIMVSTRKNA